MRNLYIRQDNGAADGGRDVPGQPHIRHAISSHPAGSLEIPARPYGQTQHRSCPTEHQMGVLRCEIEHPSSVFHGLRHIAPGQSLRGTQKGDHTRQTAKFLFVHDDHPRRQ